MALFTVLGAAPLRDSSPVVYCILDLSHAELDGFLFFFYFIYLSFFLLPFFLGISKKHTWHMSRGRRRWLLLQSMRPGLHRTSSGLPEIGEDVLYLEMDCVLRGIPRSPIIEQCPTSWTTHISLGN